MIDRKHTVLFVDDDPLVLKGLKRSVGEYEDFWVSDFVSSANNALEILEEKSFDVVITDMHMPEMDGNQLLDIVGQKWPGMIRFVLSGNTSDTQALRSTHLVHQMIPKPCDMEQIFAIVERSCRLRDMLTDTQLLRIITGVKTLPSVPLMYNRLLKEIQSENTSTQSIGNIIAQDTAMTAKILQLVNSAFFGLADNVSSPQRAVTILGLNTVKALVLGIQVFSEYQGRSNLPISIDALWKHSMLVSSLSFDIARSLNLSVQDRENARASGMLHDIGKLMLLKIPNYFSKVQVDKHGMIPIKSEYKVMGTSHAEMGAYLLGIWGLPTPIVEAITFHHRPNAPMTQKADLMTALYVANGLANMWHIEKQVNYDAYLDMAYLKKVGVAERLEEWTTYIQELVNNTNT